MIKAIIFDFDGLILDTETPWYKAYRDVFAEYGAELPLEMWAKCIGTSNDVFNPHEYLEEQLGRSVDRETVQQQTKLKFAQYMRGQTVRPGVKSYLDDAKSLGLRIGLASSSNRAWVSAYLQEHGLESFFEVVKTSDDVRNVKPDPELYVQALAELQAEAHEAVAFEDSRNGSLAAKAAGMFCVAVPNLVTSFMDFSHVDRRIHSMEEIALDQLIASISRRSN